MKSEAFSNSAVVEMVATRVFVDNAIRTTGSGDIAVLSFCGDKTLRSRDCVRAPIDPSPRQLKTKLPAIKRAVAFRLKIDMSMSLPERK